MRNKSSRQKIEPNQRYIQEEESLHLMGNQLKKCCHKIAQNHAIYYEAKVRNQSVEKLLSQYSPKIMPTMQLKGKT